jgi:hypothetical protein
MARSHLRRLGLPDLARRITGFSTPFFGVQWTPPAVERDLTDQSRAAGPVRAIRAACRRFLNEPRADFRNLYQRDFGEFRDQAGFFTALGELRATVGAQIAILAVLYKIELEAELATILPAEDADEEA